MVFKLLRPHIKNFHPTMNQLLATMAREREARKNLANPIKKKRKIDERSTIDLTVAIKKDEKHFSSFDRRSASASDAS